MIDVSIKAVSAFVRRLLAKRPAPIQLVGHLISQRNRCAASFALKQILCHALITRERPISAHCEQRRAPQVVAFELFVVWPEIAIAIAIGPT